MESRSSQSKNVSSFLSIFLDPIFVGLICGIWIFSGTLLFLGWWHVDLTFKTVWAFLLVIWIVLTPLFFGLMLLPLLAHFSAKGLDVTLLIQIISGLLKIGWLPFKIMGIADPGIVVNLAPRFLIGKGRFSECEQLVLKGLSNLKTTEKNSRRAIPFLLLAGDVSSCLGKYGEAEKYFYRALSFTSNEKKADSWLVLQSLGRFYVVAQRFDEAERCYLEALNDIHAEASRITNLLALEVWEAGVKEELAELYLRVGDLPKFLKYFDEQSFSTEGVAQLLDLSRIRLSVEYKVKEGNVAEASELIRKEKQVCQKYAKHLPLPRLKTLVSEALVEKSVGNLITSQQLYLDALTLAENRYGAHHIMLIDLLYAYADLLENQSNFDECIAMRHRADVIKEECWSKLSHLSKTFPQFKR